MKKIMLTVNDQGGGIIEWNADEISGTLRAQTHGNQPLIVLGESEVRTLIFDESQITSPTNGNNPKWNDPSHTLSEEAGRTVVIIKHNDNDDREEIL